MTPERHDEILAVTSHLPHVLSVAISSLLTDEERRFTGTGYRDMTRLADGSPEVWTDILLENDENVLRALERFHEKTGQLIETLESKDAHMIRQYLRPK